MKLAFIDPPVLAGKRAPERVFGCTYGLYPIPNIFLLQVAALLEKSNNKINYYNFALAKQSKRNFIRFLIKDKSDIYIIYSVNLAKEIDIQAARIINDINKESRVIFFGPSPTYNPDEYIFNRNIIVVRGEPEITFCELIKALKKRTNLSKIKGISFIREHKIIHNKEREIIKDLDSLPYPARNLVDNDKYFNPKFGRGKFTAMYTSRGCPFKCKFCVPCSLSFAREIEYKKKHKHKPSYRTRSAENVIQEFRMLKEQGYSYVSILDDEFVLDRKRTIDICRGIKNLGIKWGCLSRADTLNEEIVKEMSQAGCQYIDIGVESLDQEILNDINKNLDTSTIEKAITLTKKYNILTKVNILFGSSPLENKDTIRFTLKKLRKMKPDAIMFGICNPFPGTEYYNIAKKRGWFIKGDYFPIDVQKRSTISLPQITNKELEKEVRKANFHFFLNIRFIAANLRKIKSVKELFNKLNALRKKLF